MQVYGHIAESSSDYRKSKQHRTLRGAVSNATRAQMLLLKGLGMPTRNPTWGSAAPGRVEKRRPHSQWRNQRFESGGDFLKGGPLAIVWACNN